VSSETNWDALELWLNNTLIRRWSGEVDWTNFVFSVPKGTNRVEWRYKKDASFNEGLDAAFIDNVALPIELPSSGQTAAKLQLTLLADGQAQITVQGQPNRSYVLEASSDLYVWIPIGSGSSNSGVLQFIDGESAIYAVRFYRAVAQ